MKPEKTYPLTAYGLIEHVRDVFTEAEAAAIIRRIQWRKTRRQIIEDYEKEIVDRYGESGQIKEELAIKYFGSVDKWNTIDEILSRSEAAYFDRRS